VVDAEDSFQVPLHFEVTRFADDDLAHDITSLTIDSHGQVVVAGPGYVKTLYDDDGNGNADRATIFSHKPASGAHGLLFVGDDLICTGDNSLMIQRDRNGDGLADGKPEIWAQLKNGEHGGNGIVWGPDGRIYIACGNDAGVTKDYINSGNSPVTNPRSGVVLRVATDGSNFDVYAHGFRNPYDLAIGPLGNVFLVDSDGERDHHLPWYAPTRLFDIGQGLHHGWMLSGYQRSWNRPASFFDNVPRVAEMGRGSPTGAVFYRHTQFPPKYRGGLFYCDWTLGRVYFLNLSRQGSTFNGKSELFMQTTGDLGFAPVDIAVAPTGDLFVAVGGRRTRGGVFRIRYLDSAAKPVKEAKSSDETSSVLGALQPLSSWSRACWMPRARHLGPKVFEKVLANRNAESNHRIRAVEVLVEIFGGFSSTLAQKLSEQDEPEVLARVAWGISQNADATSQKTLAKWTSHADPRVARSAWQALAVSPKLQDNLTRLDSLTLIDWRAGLGAKDRRVRAAAVQFAQTSGRELFTSFLARNTFRDNLRLRLAIQWANGGGESVTSPKEIAQFVDICLTAFESTKESDIRLDAVRLLQTAFADMRILPGQKEVFSGYSANEIDRVPQLIRTHIAETITRLFPTDDEELNRESGRLLGMVQIESGETLEKIATRFTTDSTPEDDIHYLIILARLPGDRSSEVTIRVADAIVALHYKMLAANYFPSRNWPLRLGEIIEELCKRDQNLPRLITENARFGLPQHAVILNNLPRVSRTDAAHRLLTHIQKQGDEEAWRSELVRSLSVLPEEELSPVLRSLWKLPRLRDSIVSVLAKHPQPVDVARYLWALSSPQQNTIQTSVGALSQLDYTYSGHEIALILRALRRSSGQGGSKQVRQSLEGLLTTISQSGVSQPTGASASDSYQYWERWFSHSYPDEVKFLTASASPSLLQWQQRLRKIDFLSGDSQRGRIVFEQRSCAGCHLSNSRLGPDLKGAANRFSREDLFANVVDPNTNVSPAFQTKLLVTANGKVYHGLSVYESPEGTLLQTGPNTTIRVAGEEIVRYESSNRSLMPTGLLDGLSDQQLADLYAFLKNLK